MCHTPLKYSLSELDYLMVVEVKNIALGLDCIGSAERNGYSADGKKQIAKKMHWTGKDW